MIIKNINDIHFYPKMNKVDCTFLLNINVMLKRFCYIGSQDTIPTRLN